MDDNGMKKLITVLVTVHLSTFDTTISDAQRSNSKD